MKHIKKHHERFNAALFFSGLSAISMFDFFINGSGINVIFIILWSVIAFSCFIASVISLQNALDNEERKNEKLNIEKKIQQEIIEEKEWEVLKHAN